MVPVQNLADSAFLSVVGNNSAKSNKYGISDTKNDYGRCQTLHKTG